LQVPNLMYVCCLLSCVHRSVSHLLEGMRLCYMEWGSGEEVVLLLHDACESCHSWIPFSERLLMTGYKIYAIDLRGA
jgi:alpha-beta hydrolase superfamily lysophospholipase